MKKLLTLSAFLSILPCAIAEQTAPQKAEEKKVTFEEHIKPIFREHCTVCHSENEKESDLALDTYGSALTGGSSGEVIEEGNSSGSRLFALMTHAEGPFMPPDSDPIPKDQLDLIATWIDQGMPENAGSKIKRASGAAAAMLGDVTTGKPDGPPPMPESVLTQPVTETQRSSAVAAMAASPWAPLVAVGGQQQVVLYHAESGKLLGVIPFPEGEPQSLSFTRDGKQLLIGGGKHSVEGCAVLIDIATGERVTKVGDELDIVLAADISPDKSRIAIAGPQKIVRIFDSLTGDLVIEMKKHTDWIFSLRYSPDGILLASGDRSSGLIIWEAETGTLYSELTGHKGEIRSIDFRADSNVLASACTDGTIKLWDMYESKQLKSWNAHGGGATAVTYAHNGTLASAGRDSRIKLWDGDGKMLKQFDGLGDAALEVALTGDSTFIAGGDWNGKVQLWRSEDPKQVRLVVSNPLSISRRLADAQQALQSATAAFEKVNADFTRIDQATTDNDKRVSEVQQTVSGEKSSIDTLVKQLTSTESGIKEQDIEIARLQKLLASAQQTREELKKQNSESQTVLTALKKQHQQRQAELTQLQKLNEQFLGQRKAASEKKSSAEELLAVAKAEFDALAAEQDALNKRRQALQDAVATSTKAIDAINGNLASTLDEQAEQQQSLEQVSSRLATLQKQLDLLQHQLDKNKSTEQETQNALTELSTVAKQLNSELDEAQQKASEAQSRLDLFNRSYKTPQ